MDSEFKLFEWKGYAVGVFSLFFLLAFFFHYSNELFYSSFGATLSAGIIWCGYIVIRMIIMAAHSKE